MRGTVVQLRFTTLGKKQKISYLMLLPTSRMGWRGWQADADTSIMADSQSSTEEIAWSWRMQMSMRGKHSDTAWAREACSSPSPEQAIAKGKLFPSLCIWEFAGALTHDKVIMLIIYQLNLCKRSWWTGCALTSLKPLLLCAKRYEITFAAFVLEWRSILRYLEGSFT